MRSYLIYKLTSLLASSSSWRRIWNQFQVEVFFYLLPKYAPSNRENISFISLVFLASISLLIVYKLLWFKASWYCLPLRFPNTRHRQKRWYWVRVLLYFKFVIWCCQIWPSCFMKLKKNPNQTLFAHFKTATMFN